MQKSIATALLLSSVSAFSWFDWFQEKKAEKLAKQCKDFVAIYESPDLQKYYTFADLEEILYDKCKKGPVTENFFGELEPHFAGNATHGGCDYYISPKDKKSRDERQEKRKAFRNKAKELREKRRKAKKDGDIVSETLADF